MHPNDKYHHEERYNPKMIRRPGRQALRRGRVSIPNQAYFITKCIEEYEAQVLCQPACANKIIECLRWLREKGYARICGFTIMPDHYHVVIGLLAEKTLENVMASLNRYTSRQINLILGRNGKFWENGYYEHAIRDPRDFDEILLYMHYNAVKAKYVKFPQEWLFSSANPDYADLIDWQWLGTQIL